MLASNMFPNYSIVLIKISLTGFYGLQHKTYKGPHVKMVEILFRVVVSAVVVNVVVIVAVSIVVVTEDDINAFSFSDVP